jgi:hypothetical protein
MFIVEMTAGEKTPAVSFFSPRSLDCFGRCPRNDEGARLAMTQYKKKNIN